jgi:hypothetical protein
VRLHVQQEGGVGSGAAHDDDSSDSEHEPFVTTRIEPSTKNAVDVQVKLLMWRAQDSSGGLRLGGPDSAI